MRVLPVWRSLLFVPAHVDRFVERAHLRGADCVNLDLEDSVPLSEKSGARAGVAAAAARLRRGRGDVLVRINAPLSLAVADVEASVGPHIDGLILTKLLGPDHVKLLDELVSERERVAGLAPGKLLFFGLIETPEALPLAQAIAAASPRMVALSLGAEDFATAIGTEPDEENLLVARQSLLHAARAAGVMPLGLVGSIADFGDAAAFAAMARRSARRGYDGANCINPAQVAALNAAFTPDEVDVAQARRVIAADAAGTAAGFGAVALDGRMIDAPIVLRARRLLDRAAAIARREAACG